MAPLLSVSDARCRLSRHRLLQVKELSLEPGQRWGLFGTNGSGKTSLAMLLAGRRRESASYVSYRDGFGPRRDVHWVSFEEQQRLWAQDQRLDMSEYSDRAEDAGTTVQTLVSATRRVSEQDTELCQRLLEELGLTELSSQGIRFLSSGQMRRALIARALYAKHGDVPQLLIFDDPLETLDVDSQQHIQSLIKTYLAPGSILLQLCRRRQDLFTFLSHLAVLRDCELLEQGSYTSLRESNNFNAEENRQVRLLGATPLRHAQSVLPPVGTPLLRLTDVSGRYGDNWLFKHFDWELSPGEHALIAGPNGCGKSTLLSLIDGENHKAYGQQVEVMGRRRGSGETVWEVKANFGVVSNELHNRYTKGWRLLPVVLSGFHDSVGLFDEAGPNDRDYAQMWLKYLGLKGLADSYYHELSFGQQRLALLARAMVKQPPILVLDEPCVGLDRGHRDSILCILDEIASTAGTTLIYVSHVASELPKCIKQKLQFVRSGDGHECSPRYRIEKSRPG